MDHLRTVSRTLAILAISTLAALPSAFAAKISVSGFGLFGNAELRNSLRLLELDEEDLTSKRIDDGAFLILTKLVQNGYLDATLNATYTQPDGSEGDASWSMPFEAAIPEDVSAEKLRYFVEEGILYYYDTIEIRGLESIEMEEALAYFIPSNALFSNPKDRSYSPSILNTQKKQLSTALSALGRHDVLIDTVSVDLNKDTGTVTVVLEVREGPLYKVSSAKVKYTSETEETLAELPTENETYSRLWIEDQIRTLRNESYRNGYPDTKVQHHIEHSQQEDRVVWVDIRFDINRGPKIILSGVEHIGASDTHQALLSRKTNLNVGEPLDLTEVESARRRLSALGVFNRIDLSYEPDGDGKRKAVFRYTNGQRVNAQVLVGYGSYESFRAGLIGRRSNLFGRAHTATFSVVKSVKSLDAGFAYSVPELLGETVDGVAEASFLDREELNFTRRERGVSLGLSKHLAKIRSDVGLAYAFEKKRSSDPQFDDDLRLEETYIGSIALKATHNTLDNILYPRDGYEISGSFRVANDALGGEANFIKSELGATYHTRLGKRWIFHTAAQLGYIHSANDDISQVPYNELFLIGGENSIRGYQRAEAGPIDANGEPIGAEAFAQINFELEYPLFDKFNVVLFSDTVRVWAATGDLGEYDDLSSIGLGFRYNTIVGPVRLEYGHNLNPRPADPDGTILLSIGFPF